MEEGRKVRLLGDPTLRKVSVEVGDVKEGEFVEERKALEVTLEAFRKENGFGRAISAPQIGVNKRFIALNLGGENKFCMINPTITWRSEEKFTMWDDCMSFPWLLAKVERHQNISVSFTQEDGGKKDMNNCDQAVSELLQHEIDHLDGVLAVDRVKSNEDIISREAYEQNPSYFNSQVDYVIVPTL